jgi:hypothetical protein
MLMLDGAHDSFRKLKLELDGRRTGMQYFVC